MNKRSFFLGILTGAFLTLVILYAIGKIYMNSNGLPGLPIQYLEKPVSYENKSKTSFHVTQVLGKAALATESSSGYYSGKRVLILGENYYTDQFVVIKNPQRVGTYSYTENSGMPMTVPVITGEIYY